MTTWVLFAGLPGTGKSTLARALAQRLQAAVLDKDRVREGLFPGIWTDYTAEQADVCMRAMLDAARYLTGRGTRWVFFDGRTFSKQRHIDQVVQVAEQAGAGWRIVHITCDDDVAARRLEQKDPSNPAQDRNPALYQRLKGAFEPIQRPCLHVDSGRGTQGLEAAVVQYLQGAGGQSDDSGVTAR